MMTNKDNLLRAVSFNNQAASSGFSNSPEMPPHPSTTNTHQRKLACARGPRDLCSGDALLVHDDALRLKQRQHGLINCRVHRPYHTARCYPPVQQKLSCNGGRHTNLQVMSDFFDA